VEISCLEVIRELSNYADDTVDPGLRQHLNSHLAKCRHCTAVWDGMRNAIQLIGDEQSFELPAGFSRRLREKLRLAD
jgi:anti-sigma factor RsiW